MVWCLSKYKHKLVHYQRLKHKRTILIAGAYNMYAAKRRGETNKGWKKNYKMRSIKTWKAPSINRALNSSWSRWDLHTARAKILQNSNNLSCKETLRGRFGGRWCVEWVTLDETKLLWIWERNFWFYTQKEESYLIRAGNVISVRTLFHHLVQHRSRKPKPLRLTSMTSRFTSWPWIWGNLISFEYGHLGIEWRKWRGM